ncbi:MAG: winged helix-turn-helix transcriptional regulator [Clostridiales bacterium]|nr:winged helix-turn-helix transcriptional regulator [Clostridiales bacterium]HOA84865.1 winged helix-turn-helix domain-containing protein [Bacillota bacterium]
MSPKKKAVYDAAVLASDPVLDELLLLLLGEMGCRATTADAEKLPAARILIVNLDDEASVKAAAGLRGSIMIGISRHEDSIPGVLGQKCRAILHRPVSFEGFRNTVREAMSEIGRLSLTTGGRSKARRFELDLTSRCVSSGATSVKLTPSELALFSRLIEARGKTVPRDELARLIGAGASNKTEVHISNLRQKLEKTFGDRLIYTIRGGGYMIK